MDIKDVKTAMADQRIVYFQGLPYTVMEYRLCLCRNNPSMCNSGTFYHALVLKDTKANSEMHVLISDVETEAQK